MSEFERQKMKRKGALVEALPVCAECKKPSVLSPCRSCATEEQAAAYPDLFGAGVPTQKENNDG